MMTDFEIISDISKIETIAVNLSIREGKNIKTRFGGRHWRKMKGVAMVRFPNGVVQKAEIHWYEAHGIGKRKIKVKKILG